MTLEASVSPASPRARELRLRAALQAELGPVLEGLRRLRRGPRLVELIGVIAAYAGGLALILAGLKQASGAGSLALRAAGILLAAAGLNAAVLLMHEAMHGVLFARPRLNRWVAVLCGLPVCMSFSAYRVLHLAHHRHLGDARDPDDYHNYTGSARVFWALQYVRLTVGCYLYLLLIPLRAWRLGDARDRRRIVEEYGLIAIAFLLLFALTPGRAILWAWFLPAALVALMTSVRGLTQHGLTVAEDPLLASRSLRSSRWVSALLLHENLHLEHHLFPEVPSYHLPALAQALEGRLDRRCGGRSYLGFLGRFVLQSLRLDETPVGVQRREEVRDGS